jgi:hypothetical protein
MSRHMTEAQWLASTSTYDMLSFLGPRLNLRKRVLFGCATARQVWDLVTIEANRQAVLTSERYADGQAGEEEMLLAWGRLDWEPAMYVEWQIGTVTGGLSYRSPTPEEAQQKGLSKFRQRRPVEQRGADWARALRDVVGNPFHEVAVEPAWLAWNDRVVPNLAQLIYDEQRWEDLPILGDALEEAGCREQGLLDHCHGAGLHYRGCWVVDLAMGKCDPRQRRDAET